MPSQTNTIHDDIILAFNERMEEVQRKFSNVISEEKKACEEGIVPNGEVYETFVRKVRKTALSQLGEVKVWIGAHIRNEINQQVRTAGIYQLNAISDKITQVKAEQKKVEEEKERVIQNDNKLPGYEKYVLYGYQETREPRGMKRNRKVKNELSQSGPETNPGMELAYRRYKLKAKQSLIIGLAVTIVCMIIDYSMIYSMFLAANYTATGAIITALISAAMLDAPPYVFGCIWTKSDDDSSLLELQGIVDTPEAKRKKMGNLILLWIILLIIIIAFIVYLCVRVLSFLGGGDFSLGLHTFATKNWSAMDQIEFSGADFLSTIIPLSTSIVALAVGKMLFSLKTDYIKGAIVMIEEMLGEKVQNCEDIIIDCEKQIEDLTNNMATVKKEIWTFYLGRKRFPSDEDAFKTEVSLAFQKLNLPQYEKTYSDCCLFLRSRAIELLDDINSQLAEYASDPKKITSMGLSESEERVLDSYWVVTMDNRKQHPLTQSHLDSIQNAVKDIFDSHTKS